MLTPYQPPKSSQNDGISGWTLRCVDNGAVMATDRATVGRIRPKAIAIRKKTGVEGRGITYGEAADAVQALYGVTLMPMHLESRLELRNLIVSGRGAAISIDTNVTAGTIRRTNSFRGHHTVYANDAELVPNGGCRCEANIATAHWEFLIDDPGTTFAGFQWWSADLVYRACERRTGGNGINVLAGKDTEAVKWSGRAKGRIRKEPSTDAAPLGPITVGLVYPGGRTQNGGAWKRADGTTATGWIHVQTPGGKWGWINGRRLAHA